MFFMDYTVYTKPMFLVRNYGNSVYSLDLRFLTFCGLPLTNTYCLHIRKKKAFSTIKINNPNKYKDISQLCVMILISGCL